MRTTTRLLTLIAGLLLAVPFAAAEDTDIFSGTGGNGAAPQVLIVIDNGSSNDASFSYSCAANPSLNGTTILGMVNCALYTAAGAITTQPAVLNKLAMALMVYGPNQNKGGQFYYPNAQPYDPVLLDQAGISAFQNLITATPIKSAGNAKADGEFYDVWAWFTGHTNRNGDITYTPHLGTGALVCRKSFVIFIGGSVKQGRPCTGSGCSSGAELASAGATADQQIQLNTSNLGAYRAFETPLGSASWIDEWARFLHQTDFGNDPDNPQSITTYTIAIGTDEPNYNQTLESTGIQGGGKAFVVSSIDEMVKDLLSILNEIAAVNTAFASSSLPVSANAQGTFLNQVFMGQFRPDDAAGPRWAGNLKQYQFKISGSPPNEQLYLADAAGNGAISGARTGFISATAQSFWTKKVTSTLPDSIGGFWVNRPKGAGGGFDLPDGEIVDKGGAAQQMRLAILQTDYAATPHGPRNVYTCVGSCAATNSLSGFNFAADNSDITAAMLGITAPSSTLSSLSRIGTTVTAVLNTAPTPALTNGQNVTMQGAAYPELNGNFPITLVNATTFTYTINESPVSAVNSSGTYTASLPSIPKAVTSLTRVGTTTGTAQSRVTAVAPGHGYSVGQNITIAGAVGAAYNGTFPVEKVIDANTFTYLITDLPANNGGGGTATQGVNILTLPAGSITRGATAADLTTTVTVNYGASLPGGAFGAGSKVTIAGTSPSAYDGTYTIADGNANNACGANGNAGKRVFCFKLTTTPASESGGSITVDRTASTTVTLTHPVTCTGSSPTAVTTVTATSSVANSFATGNSVSIAGNPVGANESRYVGTYSINRVNSTTFMYPITVSPALCTFSTSGVSAVTNPGGVGRDALINWVRGDDNVGDEQSPGNGITVRPSLHGDVLHSRPTIVNYGDAIGVVAFYGANDGTFKAVNGNQPLNNSDPIGSAAPGGEIWSFIPVEFYKKLKRMYLNSPQIKLANTPDGITPTPLPKDYFFDGSTGVYQNGSTVYLILSGRRGVDENGKGVIYALDVSQPDDPKFMWKIIGGTTGFEELGQTWSTPKVAFVKGYQDLVTGKPRPVVIFGGGYDTNQDGDPPGSATDSVGRAIFVVDAASGALVWKAAYSGSGGSGSCTGNPCGLSDMQFSIPSDITLLNRDYDKDPGYIDRLYAADVGGNIWRVDLEPSAGPSPSNWKVTKFASLGGSGSPKRKFFYPPDVVPTKDFDMVMAGTGDREHPLYSASPSSSYAVHNRFYGLKDPNVGMEVASGWTPIVDGTASTGTAVPSGLTHVIPPGTLYNQATANNGFYIDMPNAGEKIVNAPTTVGGFSYFGTNAPPLPTSQACTNQGTARGYQVNFLTGATQSNTIDGGGLPPSPVAGQVTLKRDDGTETTLPFLLGANPDPTCQGPDCTSSFGGSRPPVPISPTRRRVYWYIDKHDN
jgi:type IV pilus assembly protein PilY1